MSIHAWLQQNQITTETGKTLDLRSHLYLFEPYKDLSPKQVILKAAQIGFSTLAILKAFWVSKNKGLDIIYTLPTEDDRNEFVSGKANRIIAQNPVLQDYVRDKDSVEQKRVGDNIIYYRGTWTKKAAIMVSSDLNIYDEVDASKPDVIEQYSTRLQHSPFKWEWYFSHPSAEGTGVDKYWQKSTQSHWFIKCSGGHEQYLSWPESINPKTEQFVCKECGLELSDEDRRQGRWVKKYNDREFSGYWIPLLICPWVSAKEILGYYNDKSEEYFYNKVLGLPYVGGGNKLTKSLLMQNLTDEVNRQEGRVVIGLDTGKELHYVVGNQQGIFFYETAKDYGEIEALMRRFPRSVVVVDQGGDLIGSRALREKYPGRVYLCTYKEAAGKTLQLVKWGAKDETGNVQADRNRMIQLVVDEFSDKRIPLQGEESDWYDYWLHWNSLTRVKETNEKTGFIRKVWTRAGADHWAHATVYWRVGMSRFANKGLILQGNTELGMRESPEITPNATIEVNTIPYLTGQVPVDDWRIH